MLGGLQAGRVILVEVPTRAVVGLRLDQQDVDSGVAVLPLLDGAVQAVVGDHPQRLVGDRDEAHVGDAPHARAEIVGTRLPKSLTKGTIGLTTTMNLAPFSTAMSTLVVERMPPSTISLPLISTGS